jgi:iron(III) transport system ATP-binding protein
MVFQDYALFPHLTVAGNVAFGLRGRPRAAIRATVAALLERVRLSPMGARYPHMLSGGERQRVALARALAPAPRVVLMDEPFSSLDGALRDDVRDEAIALMRETGTTGIVVTHEPDEALRIADRIALVERGRLVECGTPQELYSAPETMAAARLFGHLNELAGRCRNGRIETPLGAFDAGHVRELAACSVCIRPEHLRLTAAPASVTARVLRTTFLDGAAHVLLQVPGIDVPLAVRYVRPARVEPDDVVNVDVQRDGVFVVPSEAVTSRSAPQFYKES